MGSMSTITLACNYAISSSIAGSGVGELKLNSKPSFLGFTKRMPIIRAKAQAQAENFSENIEKVDKVRRASLIGLGAALVASPFSSPAFADIIGKHNLIMETAALKRPIKVAGIAGNLAKRSRNRWLLRAAMEICEESVPGMEIEDIDISGLPIINVDLIVDGKCPPEVEEVRQKIKKADSVLFATPEYNYAVTPVMKNVLDWGSIDPNVWDDKPAAMMSGGAELGAGLSQFNLRQIGVRPNIQFINQPQLFLRIFEEPNPFDPDGNLIDQAARDTIKKILLELKSFTLRLHPELLK